MRKNIENIEGEEEKGGGGGGEREKILSVVVVVREKEMVVVRGRRKECEGEEGGSLGSGMGKGSFKILKNLGVCFFYQVSLGVFVSRRESEKRMGLA